MGLLCVSKLFPAFSFYLGGGAGDGGAGLVLYYYSSAIWDFKSCCFTCFNTFL